MYNLKKKKFISSSHILSYTPIPSITTLNYNKPYIMHTSQSTTKEIFHSPSPLNPTIDFLINPSITSHITSQFVLSTLQTAIRSFHQTVYYVLIHFPISRGTREKCMCARVCTNSTNSMHFYGIRGTSLLG